MIQLKAVEQYVSVGRLIIMLPNVVVVVSYFYTFEPMADSKP